MLRGILDSHPSIAALPELFHERYPDAAWPEVPELTYYEPYYLERIREDIENALPRNQKENVRSYLKLIAKLGNKAGVTPLVDIKYNSLHHAEGSWKNPVAPPVMLQIIKNRSFPVIHLHRQNLLGVVISLFRAQITAQYVAQKTDDVAHTTFKIEPERLLHQLDQHEATEKKTGQWLKQMGIQCLDVNYEELFIDGPGSEFNRESFDRIAEYMGVDPSLLIYKARTKRLAGRTYREEIENFDEIEKALRGTPYHGTFTA